MPDPTPASPVRPATPGGTTDATKPCRNHPHHCPGCGVEIECGYVCCAKCTPPGVAAYAHLLESVRDDGDRGPGSSHQSNPTPATPEMDRRHQPGMGHSSGCDCGCAHAMPDGPEDDDPTPAPSGETLKPSLMAPSQWEAVQKLQEELTALRAALTRANERAETAEEKDKTLCCAYGNALIQIHDLVAKLRHAEAAGETRGLEMAAKVCESRSRAAADHAMDNDGLGWTASGEAMKCAMAIRVLQRPTTEEGK